MISKNAVMSSCEKGGIWEQMLRQLQRMKRLSVLTTVVTFSAAMSSLATAIHWQKALHFLQKEPNSVMKNAALVACEKGSCWAKALEVLNLITEPDLITLNAALSACSKLNRPLRRQNKRDIFQLARWRAAIELLTSMSVEKDEGASAFFSPS